MYFARTILQWQPKTLKLNTLPHPQPEASIKFIRKELRLRNIDKLKFPKIVKVESNIPTSV
jgi:hypothetical protein